MKNPIAHDDLKSLTDLVKNFWSKFLQLKVELKFLIILEWFKN